MEGYTDGDARVNGIKPGRLMETVGGTRMTALEVKLGPPSYDLQRKQVPSMSPLVVCGGRKVQHVTSYKGW